MQKVRHPARHRERFIKSLRPIGCTGSHEWSSNGLAHNKQTEAAIRACQAPIRKDIRETTSQLLKPIIVSWIFLRPQVHVQGIMTKISLLQCQAPKRQLDLAPQCWIYNTRVLGFEEKARLTATILNFRCRVLGYRESLGLYPHISWFMVDFQERERNEKL